MFKIRNGTGGVLPLQLERGAIMLQPGKTFDLDGVCSRKWIKTNESLQKLIAFGHVILIHDSERGVPDQPIENVTLKGKHAKRDKKVQEKPVIVDFSNVPEPEKELPLEELAEKQKPKKKPKTKKPRKAKKPVEVVDVVEAKPEEDPLEDLPAEDPVEEVSFEFENHTEDTSEAECPICGKLFKGERGLNAHMRVHKDE